MAVIDLTQMPTLSALYHSKALEPSAKAGLPTPNQKLNDKVSLIKADITELEIDVIVNAANDKLKNGTGVNGAVFIAAGKDSLGKDNLENYFSSFVGEHDEHNERHCKAGGVMISAAYNLPCRLIFHAVGPKYDESAEPEKELRSCYKTSLELAAGCKCKSIAFCALSVGEFKYPKDKATPIALDEVKKFLLGDNGQKIDKVVFCTHGKETDDQYRKNIP